MGVLVLLIVIIVLSIAIREYNLRRNIDKIVDRRKKRWSNH